MTNKFSQEDIEHLYKTKVKLPIEYFNKYTILPKCPIKSYNYSWGNYDFPRNWCVLDFIEWINKYNIKNTIHLGCTCDSDCELEFLNYKKKTILQYPPYDLHTVSEQYTGDMFDFFIFNQTLEHLYNPFEAVKQIHKIINSGGYVFTSVPTINIPHMVPIHFNGFTPMGLAMLFKTAGFEIVEIGQWGNYKYIQKLFATHQWPGYIELHNNNMVINEERNCCQCWILARKT